MDITDPRPSDAGHDEWLVLRCQIGERDAFDALVARWHPLLWRYAARLTNDPDAAADAAQEVWLRVLRGLPKLREAAKFRAWLFGIARRVLMDRLRARYGAPEFEEVDLGEIPAATAADHETDDLVLLQSGIDRLPVLERDVLVLFYLDDLSLAEIAEIASIPIGTVKSRLFRARQHLRDELTHKGVHP